MTIKKSILLGMLIIAVSSGAVLVVAQSGIQSLLPQSSGSQMWQSSFTEASGTLTEEANVNIDNTVAWSAGANNRPILFIPDAEFSVSALERGSGPLTAGYLVEFQFTEAALATSAVRSAAAQQQLTETAGLGELEISQVGDSTYQADVRGGGITLISFRFELTVEDLNSIENGGSVTVSGENNSGADPLYELEEMTVTLAESGQIVIAAFTFTEFD